MWETDGGGSPFLRKKDTKNEEKCTNPRAKGERGGVGIGGGGGAGGVSRKNSRSKKQLPNFWSISAFVSFGGTICFAFGWRRRFSSFFLGGVTSPPHTLPVFFLPTR